MKVLKIVLISFAALVIALFVAAVIFIKTLDINRFKPQIMEQAGRALGRQVDYGKASLGISIFRGVSLRVDDLTIGEDPAFGTGNFLSVKSLSVGVDVLGYLFRKQISVTGIVIDSPAATVIRKKDGSINAQTLAKPAPAVQLPGAGGQLASPAAPTAAALPALFVSSLKGQNGTVKYIDLSFQPALIMEISGLDFAVTGLSLDKPFSFSAQAKVLSGQQNVRLSGKCQLDLQAQSATISGLKADIDLSRILLKSVPQMFPMVPPQALPVELKGSLEMTVDKLVAGAKGLASMDADVRLSGGSAKFKEMAQPVKDIAAEVSLTEKDALIDSFSAGVGQGTLKGKGEIKDYLAGQVFSFEASADKLSLPDLVDQKQFPAQAEGLLSEQANIKGKGFTPAALNSLSGKADILVSQPKLKGLNVLRMVLDKLAVIPGLGDPVEQGLPDTYKQKLTQKDTVLSDIKLAVTIAGGRASIDDTMISSDDFIFKGKGDAGFDGSYSLEGSFLVTAGLSQAMVSSAPQLQYLLNEEKMIYIPLKVSGTTVGKPQFNLNADYIARKLVQNQAKQQIFRALEKAMGGSGSQGQAAGQDQQGAVQPQGSQSDTEQTINNLLGNIFKKR